MIHCQFSEKRLVRTQSWILALCLGSWQRETKQRMLCKRGWQSLASRRRLFLPCTWEAEAQPHTQAAYAAIGHLHLSQSPPSSLLAEPLLCLYLLHLHTSGKAGFSQCPEGESCRQQGNQSHSIYSSCSSNSETQQSLQGFLDFSP